MALFIFIFIHRTGSKNKQQKNKKKQQQQLNYETLTKYYKLIQNLPKNCLYLLYKRLILRSLFEFFCLSRLREVALSMRDVAIYRKISDRIGAILKRGD